MPETRKDVMLPLGASLGLDAPDHDPLALELVASGLDAVVDGGLESIIHDDLHDEVHAASQIEAEVDLALLALEVEGWPDEDEATDEERAVDDRRVSGAPCG